MNTIKFSTKPNINGNTYGLEIDTTNRTINWIFRTSKDDIKVTKRDLGRIGEYFRNNGFIDVLNIKRG